MDDPGVQVQVHNATELPVVYGSVRLAPGETYPDVWRSSFQHPGQVAPHDVAATEEAHRRIFCRVYTTEDLQRSNYRIEIVPGEIQC